MAYGYGAPGYEGYQGLRGPRDDEESAITAFLRSMVQQRQPQLPPGGGVVAPEPEPPLGSMPQFIQPVTAQESDTLTPDYSGGETKTERAPLQFAWGGGTPQDYKPGQTDIYALPGAPRTTQGFMPAGGTVSGPQLTMDVPGASGGAPLPVSQRQSAGGVGAAPWEDVANPVGMPGYEESITRALAERERMDPLWREKAQQELQLQGTERLMQTQSGLAQATRAKSIEDAVMTARDGAVRQTQRSPEYAKATPEQRQALEAQQADDAESMVRQAFLENLAKGRGPLPPTVPRISVPSSVRGR